MTQLFQLFDQVIRQFGGQPWLSPVLGAIGVLLVFLILFTTRDILLRTQSLIAQLLSILLVALLPGAGFLLYLLLRPARTVMQRQTDAMVRELHDHVFVPSDEPEGSQEEAVVMDHVLETEEVSETKKSTKSQAPRTK